jgi:hypothetical protein
MVNETDRAASPPKVQDDSNDAQKALRKKLSRIANKSARRVVSRLQRYDGKRSIFTK